MTMLSCKYLEHSITIEPNGLVKPCCRYTEPGVDYSSHSSLFNVARQQMREGKWAQGCSRCSTEESLGNSSMRTNSLKPYNKFNRVPQHDSNKLTYLEITTGRYCNLKCRMCDPVLSTSWDEDLEHSEPLVKWFYGSFGAWEQDKATPKTTNTMLELDRDACSSLREIKVTGGEPFLSEYLAEFLQRLVDWDLASNITLDIFTNATFIPKHKYIKNFKKFNTVFLNMSIDGTGARGEFIRKKSDWSKVKETVAWYCKQHIENKNIYLGISHTQSLYNVLYYREFIDWCTSNINDAILNDKESFFLNTTQLSEPKHLSIYNLNNKQKQQALQVIDNDFNSFDFNNSKWHRQIQYSLTQLKNSLAVTLEDTTTSAINDFNKHERIVDAVRQENWATVFPRLEELLNE